MAPLHCVFLVRSLPAKSTILMRLMWIFSLLSTLLLISRVIEKMACERDEFLFNLCSLIVRLVSPSNMISNASSSLVHFGYIILLSQWLLCRWLRRLGLLVIKCWLDFQLIEDHWYFRYRFRCRIFWPWFLFRSSN